MQPKTAKRRSAFRRANRTMPRRRIDIATEAIDYKNPDLLKKFVTESGKILPRRVTGMPAHMHRKITREPLATIARLAATELSPGSPAPARARA